MARALAELKARFLAPFAPLQARLAGRPDTEHEQAIVRVLVGTVLFFYLLPESVHFSAGELTEGRNYLITALVFFVCAAGIFADLLKSPSVSPTRRVLGVFLDIATVTYFMAQLGSYGIPMFLIYIWVTLGNGVRFGARYLVLSLVVSVMGFSIVLATSDFWQGHRIAGIGLVAGMMAMAFYVRSLVTKLFDALARAEAANKAKRRFISVVSHEMRTPLNAIIGMADLLRDTSLNREQADMLQTLRGSSRLLLGLVEDVLDFSKIEAGKVTLESADFDLHALVNSTCRILAAQAAPKGVEFVVSIMPEVPHALRGDPHYLRQILINLAGNAIKFTERGSVTVHVSAQQETETGVRLKFSIRDTGIGISPEAQARIFNSFTQADDSTSRRFGGTGLGTTIAKRLVELMGGRIGLESAVGLGSTFWCELPFEKQSERAGATSGEIAGARVLFVGFPQEQRDIFDQALAGWGATPVFVASVEEGAARLVAEISLARPYQSALLWSEGDLTLAERFRRAAPEPAPPSVLAVPRELQVPRFDALSAGFSAVLEIPFDKRQLFNVLHSVSAGDEVREGVVRLHDYAKRDADVRKLRILVADDNPTNREVIGKILERGGHGVTLVQDGEEALDAAERDEYDVVILDRNMPRTGGIEALQAMRVMSSGGQRTPVIILSADVTPEAKQEAFEVGADAFLAKPIEALRLLDEIRAITAGRPEERERRRAEPEQSSKRPPVSLDSNSPVVDLETLGHLEELGSSPGFVKKLADVFITDNAALAIRIEEAVASRNYAAFRSHLHALKGSSASMGTERLTRLCTSLSAYPDSELKLQGPKLLRSLVEELAAARNELERYLHENQRSAS